jgi:hypothetical protein
MIEHTTAIRKSRHPLAPLLEFCGLSSSGGSLRRFGALVPTEVIGSGIGIEGTRLCHEPVDPIAADATHAMVNEMIEASANIGDFRQANANRKVPKSATAVVDGSKDSCLSTAALAPFTFERTCAVHAGPALRAAMRMTSSWAPVVVPMIFSETMSD